MDSHPSSAAMTHAPPPVCHLLDTLDADSMENVVCACDTVAALRSLKATCKTLRTRCRRTLCTGSQWHARRHVAARVWVEAVHIDGVQEPYLAISPAELMELVQYGEENVQALVEGLQVRHPAALLVPRPSLLCCC